MARTSRVAARAAAASLRTPTSPAREPPNNDHDMPDAPPSDAATPAKQDEDDDDAGEGEEEEEDDQGNGTQEELPDESTLPAPDSELDSRSTSSRRRGRSSTTLARNRRAGRSLKAKQDGSDEEVNDAPSDVNAPPRRRGGFRGHRGGRWSRRGGGGPSHVSQIPVDKDGKPMDVAGDEVVTTPDPEGEKKIDQFGYLQDGREYRVRTFTIIGRGKRLYMLSTEPARCIGFRDSYLFFQKHRRLYKIIIDEEEKRDLIERRLIPHSYKGRAIGVVTARSVYREFGAKIVIGGKNVVDDYDVAGARARGDVEGALAVPEDRIPRPGEPYNRNQYVAWHGASAVYHSGAPSLPAPSLKAVDGRKRKVTMTSDNWMLQHAREASRFNTMLTARRREGNQNQQGYYDIHTNSMQFPATTQPTHVRWERLSPRRSGSVPTDKTRDSSPNRADEHLPLCDQPSSPPPSDSTLRTSQQTSQSSLSSLPPIYSHQFLIQDLGLSSRPVAPFTSNLGSLNDPRALFFSPPLSQHDKYDDGYHQDAKTNGCNIMAELPASCRQSLRHVQQQEKQWAAQWAGTESRDSHRTVMASSVEWFP